MKTRDLKYSCRSVEKLVYLADDELSPGERAILREHLANCRVCSGIRQSVMTTRENVLAASRLPDERPAPEFLVPASPPRTTGYRLLHIIRIASSVAAILLLVLFGSEQALTARKISRLEHRVQRLSSFPASGIFDQAYRIRMTLGEKEWNDILTGLGIDIRSKTLPESVRIRSRLETGIRSRLPFGAFPPRPFDNPLLLRRQYTNIKNH
jgi:hypothetical protein